MRIFQVRHLKVSHFVKNLALRLKKDNRYFTFTSHQIKLSLDDIYTCKYYSRNCENWTQILEFFENDETITFWSSRYISRFYNGYLHFCALGLLLAAVLIVEIALAIWLPIREKNNEEITPVKGAKSGLHF